MIIQMLQKFIKITSNLEQTENTKKHKKTKKASFLKQKNKKKRLKMQTCINLH